MANTPNINLVKPLGTDKALVSVINDNSDKIDAFAGSVNTNMAKTQDGFAIVVNGNNAPKAITAGQYLFIKNHSTLSAGGYHATANIANGAAITSSNVAADADGVVNGAFSVLNSNITTKAPKGTKINISRNYTNQQSNVFEYVDISFVVPALSEFIIHVDPIYNLGEPLGSLISNSNTDISPFRVVAKSPEGSVQCSFCGYNYTNSAKTYYIWVNRKNTSVNPTNVYGVIRQLEI